MANTIMASHHAGPAITVALAGNPNAGKTTVFNALTGANQKIGNYPGKTIERMEGICHIGDDHALIVDLPGTYSLSAFSAEEVIAMDFLLKEMPDLIVIVLDASNIERNLYLAFQILEMRVPTLLVLNMSDEARAHGITIDHAQISTLLNGTPIVATSAVRGEGIEDLKAAIAATAMTRQRTADGDVRAIQPGTVVSYGDAIEARISSLMAAISDNPLRDCPWDARWLAIKLLEEDDHLILHVSSMAGSEPIIELAHQHDAAIEAETGEDPGTIFASYRYQAINDVVTSAVKRDQAGGTTFSDRVDAILTHPLWGMGFFVLVMYLVFQVTSSASAPLLDWIGEVFAGPFTAWIVGLFGQFSLNGSILESLIIHGALPGIGTVMSFAPIMLVLYLCMALLEDSGYMARAAFMGDRFLSRIGLNGKSFIPLMLGFGCNVPAITATRVLERKRDRILTGLLIPFMSCGARLPVYTLFGIAFFGPRAGLFIISLYALGVGIAIAVSLVLQKTLLSTDEEMPFIIELPPYRKPSIKYTWRSTWDRTMGFIKNAWSLVLAVSVILWVLMAIPVGDADATFGEVAAENSALAAAGGLIAPLLEPAGYGTWEASSALITGFVAKEIVVASLSTVYTGGDYALTPTPMGLSQGLKEIGSTLLTALADTLKSLASILPGVTFAGDESEEADTALLTAIRSEFTPLSAVSYCVLVLLTVPCSVTIAVMRREYGLKWTLISIGLMLIVSWIMSVLVFQGGTLLGLG